MKIEYFLTSVFCFVFVKNWQRLNLCSSQSKRLTIARYEIKWLYSDKILCSWSIQENLAMYGKKQSPPSTWEKPNTLNYPRKKTKHLKTTWTGHYLKFRFQTQKRQSWFDTKIGMSNYLDWKMTHLKLHKYILATKSHHIMANPLLQPPDHINCFSSSLKKTFDAWAWTKLDFFFSSEIRVLFFHFSLLQSDLKVSWFYNVLMKN